VAWTNTLQQLHAEYLAAQQLLKAAGTVLTAARRLAPRGSRRPKHQLQVRTKVCVGVISRL
jgi:hypothetical protein